MYATRRLHGQRDSESKEKIKSNTIIARRLVIINGQALARTSCPEPHLRR